MNSLETDVLRLIGENVDSPDVFTDTDAGIAFIRDCLNDAIQELCMVTGSYARVYHLPLLENRQFYRISSVTDFVAYPIEVWDRANKRRLIQTDVVRLSALDPWWMQGSGPAEQYFMLGVNNIGIYRVPSSKGVVLEIKCALIPKPYADSGAPIKLRDAFHRAAVNRAVSEFYASRGDASRAGDYFTQYLEIGNLMVLNPQYAEQQVQYGGFRKPWFGKRDTP